MTTRIPPQQFNRPSLSPGPQSATAAQPTVDVAQTFGLGRQTMPAQVGMTHAQALMLGVPPQTPGMLATSPHARPGPAPYFSQVQPLPNWEVNCVPTSVAMVLAKLNPTLADAMGFNPSIGMFDSNQLVHNLSSWMVDQQGGQPGLIDFGVLAQMLNNLGMPAEGVDGLDIQALRAGLAFGRQAIVMGDAKALPSSDPSVQAQANTDDALHAIVVTAQDPRTGNFLINDPQDPAVAPRWVSEAQLARFSDAVNRNIHGAANGVMVLVG